MTELMKVENVLRTLAPHYDHVVVAIEESKTLANMKLEDLLRCVRKNEKDKEKATEQALLA